LRTIKRIPLTQGKEAIIDIEDWKLVKDYKWCVRKDHSTFYAYTGASKKRNHKNIQMHRLLMSVTKDKQVDHINHNGLDNRKSNLRVCSHSQNQQNKEPQKNVSSRYKGVVAVKNKKKWIAQIRINNKLNYLGYFDNEIEAAKAYDRASLKFHKEYGYLNFSEISNHVH